MRYQNLVKNVSKDLPNAPGLYCLVHEPTNAAIFKLADNIYKTAKRWPRAIANPSKNDLVSKSMRDYLIKVGPYDWRFEYVVGGNEADRDTAIQNHKGICLNAERGRPQVGGMPSPVAVLGALTNWTFMRKRPLLGAAVAAWPVDETINPVDHLLPQASHWHFAEFLWLWCRNRGRPGLANANPSPDVIAHAWSKWRPRAAADYPQRPLPDAVPRSIRDALDLPDWREPVPWRNKKI